MKNDNMIEIGDHSDLKFLSIVPIVIWTGPDIISFFGKHHDDQNNHTFSSSPNAL